MRGNSPPVPPKKMPIVAVIVLVAVVFSCVLYANLSFAITDPAGFRFFPPFESGVNGNRNGGMRGEDIQMAQALVAGKGFADPFMKPTGPSAWQPPVLPLYMAGLLRMFGGNLEIILGVRVILQAFILVGTGLLILPLAEQTNVRIRTGGALVVYLVILLWNFRTWFQFTLDCGMVLLALDLVIAGFCWLAPFSSWQRAVTWGALGGIVAMVSPVVGFAWGMLTLWSGVGRRSWLRLGVALLCAGLVVTPWTIRNYLVFGRLIPLKSNLAFELYQSQCLQPGGLLSTFHMHPSGMQNEEGRLYKELGETLYLDRKWEQFVQSVAADPFDYLDRVATRFLGATLWYTPMQRDMPSRPWVFWLSRVLHPIPFLAMMFLLFTSVTRPLRGAQWVVIGAYVFYLLPYIVISYYDRYGAPLVGVKALLVIWAADRLLSLRRREMPQANPI